MTEDEFNAEVDRIHAKYALYRRLIVVSTVVLVRVILSYIFSR